MCNKLIHKYFFLFFRLQHNYGDRFLYFYTGTLLWRPIFALVESQKKSSGSPTDCVILFVSVESKFLTAYQQSFSIDFFFLLFCLFCLVFEESKMNEVVAEIRLLKELQNCNDIGELEFLQSRTLLVTPATATDKK